jgi:anaerobic magnesium-protoporphyrin IX monomethyl ester cyclase
MPPLGSLICAAVLRERGFDVRFFDAMLASSEDECGRAMDRERPDALVIFEDSFNYLTKMCLERMREAAVRMIALARSRGIEVVVAGSDATDDPGFFLRAGASAVAAGEAEFAVADWLAGPDASPRSIPGIITAGSDGVVEAGASRSPVSDLDSIPSPAWDLIDLAPYRRIWARGRRPFSLPLATSRGCPFHCNWCAKPIWGQRYAMRSPANVASEMAWIKQHLRPDHLWFADDIFGLRPAWVAELGREVAARDAAIPFMIQSRVDLMTDDAVAGLKQAGCVEVWMGAESGSQKVLDAMDKGTQVAQIKLARARLKQAGIKACFFIQFGYPGETFDDIMATVQLVRETLPDNIGVSVSYPLPGTKFHEMVKEQLGEKTNWVDSNDLAMMFQGSYQSPFYRKLHRVLHRDLEVRQRLARQNTNGHGPGVVPDADLFSVLDHLSHEWMELGRLEVLHRSERPTMIVKPYGAPAAPDTSRDWN